MTTASPTPGRRAAGPRLLLVSPSGGRGGAEAMLLRLAAAATSRGWAVHALVPAGPLGAALERAGAATGRIPALALADGGRAVAAGRLALALLRARGALARAQRDADVVLVNGLLALPLLRLVPRRTPRVWWAHDVVVRGDRLRLLAWCAPALDRVLAVSESVRGRLTGLAVRVDVVRNGVDLPPDPLTGRPAGPPVVGIAAALTSWKGQHVLLDAVARLPAQVQLEVLGAALPKDAAYADALAARAARPDLAGRTRFLGHVDDPLAVMRGWSIGVSASTDPEASGLAFLEGLSLGVPQVVTAGGGPQEVLDGAGLVVPPHDDAALADALRRLLDDAALWSRCSAAGPAVVRAVGHRPRQEHELLERLREAAGALA